MCCTTRNRGNLVFDGFCGTGMAGVAARLCADRSAIAALGSTLTPDGKVLDENQEVFSRCGARIPILNDLSPAATLITAGYNLTNDSESFISYARATSDQVQPRIRLDVRNARSPRRCNLPD